MAEVHLELLMGKVVHDHRGRRVGRIEEVRAARDKDGWIVTHYFLGPVGLMQRVSIRLWLLTLRGRRWSGLRRVRWRALDLSDPRNPRLIGPARPIADNDALT